MAEWCGLVAAGSAATAEAASTVLRAGGNAFDAVVAAGLAATAAEPILASLGGGGFILVRTAAGDEVLVDAFVAAPGLGGGVGASSGPAPMESVTIRFGAAEQVFHVGAGSVAVPGLLAGLRHVWDRWGRLEWGEAVAPAVAVARSGVTVDAVFERVVALVWPILVHGGVGAELFGKGDAPLRAGGRFASAALAATLEGVAAERWVTLGFDPTVIVDSGGAVGVEDLARYQVVEREPLRVRVDGATVVSNPLPSFGAELIAHALQQLEVGGQFRGAGHVDVVELARALASMSTRRQELGPGASRGTTHVSVADAEGNVATMTVSNGAGSGVFAGDTGVQLNNMLGEEDLHPGGLDGWVPGARIGSMMAPMVVELADGSFVACGSGGSERIRSALLQVVVALVGRGASVGEAVDAARLHWDGTMLQVEGGTPLDVVVELERAGFSVNQWTNRDFYFGGVHAVGWGPRGYVAVGDPRRGGVGMVVER